MMSSNVKIEMIRQTDISKQFHFIVSIQSIYCCYLIIIIHTYHCKHSFESSSQMRMNRVPFLIGYTETIRTRL